MRERVSEFFALEDEWERPRPQVSRGDVITAAAFELVGLATMEMARSAGAFEDVDVPWWGIYLVLSAAAVALLFRRRYPLTVGLYLAGHMFATGLAMPQVMGQLSLQICYFFGLFSAMAWGRSRRTALLVSGTILLFMLCWVGSQFAIGSGMQDFLGEDAPEERGFLAPIPAIILLTFVINVVYFLGAIIGGQVAWRSARQRAALSEQAVTITAQADSLRRRAVVDERLRIARELHDVVGHHVSVIGVQAAGARRVMSTDEQAATEALGAIEESSREAVTQMRSLLGTLREIEAESGDTEEAARTSGPGVADLEELVTRRANGTLRTSYDVVEVPTGAAGRLPAAVGLSLYRTAQEALANVVRHSTASQASVTLRVQEDGPAPYAEIEVLDDGRLRPGSSGTGLGHLGIRERAASHRGEVEVGPRATRGYRVRVRLPLGGARG